MTKGSSLENNRDKKYMKKAMCIGMAVIGFFLYMQLATNDSHKSFTGSEQESSTYVATRNANDEASGNITAKNVGGSSSTPKDEPRASSSDYQTAVEGTRSVVAVIIVFALLAYIFLKDKVPEQKKITIDVF